MKQIDIDKILCCGCMACYNTCKFGAISIQENEQGFLEPIINKEICKSCGACAKVCPVLNAKEEISVGDYPRAYAVINKDENTRANSSSGGVFTLLALNILNNGGVVFGAAFNDNNMVEHIMVEHIDDINKLQGSKYLQSSIGNSYKKAEEMLNMGRNVLFTGTPCQIEGLKAYLNKEYENLYTQDVICHGVPSPKVWREYIKHLNIKGKISINFRNKKNGWKKFALSLKSGNKDYLEYHGENMFMRAFLKNICLRKSCYNCSFKKYVRNSDITLADFWGIDKILPDMFDNKGTSLVVVNNPKGKDMLNYILKYVKCISVDLNTAIKYNTCMTKSVDMHSSREEFFCDLGNISFDKLIDKYLNN